MIRIDAISTFDRIRQADRKHVDALAESIREVGLLNPITVAPKDDGFVLIAGMHRIEACRMLGWHEIPATILDLDHQRQIIAECDENLCAPVLSASERAMFTKRRKDAYEALHPETKNGENQHTRVRQVGEGSTAERFTADTAAKTGQSERAIQRDAERGAKVTDEALDAVRGSKLDTGRYLDTLKSVPAEDQVAKVQADLVASPAQRGEASTETDEDPATAKARRDLAKLTRDALEDEVIGLRADLSDAKAEARKLKAENHSLKEKLKDFSGDSAEVIRRLQKTVDHKNSEMYRVNENFAVEKRKNHVLNKRIQQFEQERGLR